MLCHVDHSRLLGGPPLQLAVLLPRAVGDHRVEPGTEEAPALERADLPGDLHQYVLRRFLGVLAARQEAPAPPQDLGADRPQQLVQGTRVTGRGPPRQLLGPSRVPHWIHSSASVYEQA